jgi:hypothetical protein
MHWRLCFLLHGQIAKEIDRNGIGLELFQYQDSDMYFLTRYLSVATDTKIRSSPTLTFSPSDRCLEAGWSVHQHDSPVIIRFNRKVGIVLFYKQVFKIALCVYLPWECSCKPTSNANLSFPDVVERHARY